MNERTNLQDIAELLVERHGLDKKDAELFIENMFELIEESLATEKYVKIKGLGTFKLTEVDTRESVDVNTGERIEILGHTKVSFAPDATMKELINKPFSHFETVVLNDGVELEDLAETEVAGIEEVILKPVTLEEPLQEDVAIAPAMEEPVVEVVEEPVSESQEEVVVEESQLEVPVVEDGVQHEVPMVDETVDDVEESQEEVVEITKEEKLVDVDGQKRADILWSDTSRSKEKNIIRILLGIIAVLMLIILCGCYWLFIQSESSSERVITPVVQEKIQVEEVIEEVGEDTLVMEEKLDSVLSEVPLATPTFQEPKDDRIASLADTLEYRIVGTKGIYTLQNGESIIKVSVKFFGSKMFWPYIVKYNRDVIKNADNIPVGAQIKIPELVSKH